MTRHIVFGTGQVGRLLARQLVDLGHDVIAVNRSGRGDIPGAQVVAGDATDPGFTSGVAAHADVVYFCLNATNYNRWDTEFPPLQRGVLAGADAAGARLVVQDNLYAYGPTQGRDLVETMQARPTSVKAGTRAAMTAELLGGASADRAAHQAGRVEVAIGRASDYFGPGTTGSALGETVFGAALSGKTAQVMGDPDSLHSYSYTPDVAAALITLGTRPGGTGSVWHLPVDRRAAPGRSSMTSTPSPVSGPGASRPARPPCAWWASPSRPCASTSARCTSSPTAGWWTTTRSGPPSVRRPRRCRTRSPTPCSGFGRPPRRGRCRDREVAAGRPSIQARACLRVSAGVLACRDEFR
jgi:nucleoside-diphosphate-sugar epimerase